MTSSDLDALAARLAGALEDEGLDGDELRPGSTLDKVVHASSEEEAAQLLLAFAVAALGESPSKCDAVLARFTERMDFVDAVMTDVDDVDKR